MNVYEFTGHLSPLPPGVKLPLQLSGKVCLASDVLAMRSELIKLAASLVRGGDIPSDYSEDHPARMRRGYWIKQLERVHSRDRELAMKLKKIADQLSPSATGES